MDEKSLYAAVLGVTSPWGVEKVDLRLTDGEIHVFVALPAATRWVCPECLAEAPIHDHQERVWRHLDTCQYRTLIHARVPRLHCATHGIKQIKVPWAEPLSRFTALFEALAIDWMKQACISAVAERMGLSWDEAAGIQARAVRRGLARREAEAVCHVGVDETSFQKRHEYVTVVSDLARGRVLYVGDDRKRETLDAYWTSLTAGQREEVKAVGMDMWEPYIQSVLAHVPQGAEKIVFDRYHIMAHMGQAVDRVRRHEHRALSSLGNETLTGTKYFWLYAEENLPAKHWERFFLLKAQSLKTARAWAMKENLRHLWSFSFAGWAERYFRRWYFWATHSRLQPVIQTARMIKRHWANIKTYFSHRITNAGAEAMNAKIQAIKSMSRGFRNRERFRNAIYFHCGGLNLYPAGFRSNQ